MSKPKAKRTKKYRPTREARPDAAAWAIAGVHVLTNEQCAQLFDVEAGALTLLKQGRAKPDDWNVLCQCLNVAEALAGLQIGPNLLLAIAAGQQALIDVALRMQDGRNSTCYASELAAIEEALTMYRIQLKLCTQAELSRALRKVKDMHRSGATADVGEIYERMQAAA